MDKRIAEKTDIYGHTYGVLCQTDKEAEIIGHRETPLKIFHIYSKYQIAAFYGAVTADHDRHRAVALRAVRLAESKLKQKR